MTTHPAPWVESIKGKQATPHEIPKAHRVMCATHTKGNTMKTTILALILTAAAAPIYAKTIAGCEVVQVEGTNYFNKADPTCVFNTPVGTRVLQEGDAAYFPSDNNPLTNLTRVESDT